eukprot:6243992-Lingulodinium_polyedra.AAC.1
MLCVVGLGEGELQPLCVAAARKEGCGAVCQIAYFYASSRISVGGTEGAISFLKDAAEKTGALQAR